MEKKKFARHMKEGIPFVVYPDPIMWDPEQHPGEDAHEVYREFPASYRLGVNLEAVEDFRKKEPLSYRVARAAMGRKDPNQNREGPESRGAGCNDSGPDLERTTPEQADVLDARALHQ